MLTVEQVFIVCQHVLCGLIGFIGNVLVLVVYVSKLKDNQTITFFIVHLAISDLSCCMILLPINCYVEMVNQHFDSNFLCKFHQFLNIMNITYSCFLMVMIAFERYFSIIWPVQKIITKQRGQLMIALLLLVSSGFAIFGSLAYGLDYEAIKVNSIDYENGTKYSVNQTILVRTDFCSVNNLIVKIDLVSYLRLIQNLIPVVSFLIIFVLYAGVFGSVCKRRAIKKQRASKYYRSIMRRSTRASLGLNSNNTSTSCMVAQVMMATTSNRQQPYLDVPSFCSNVSTGSLSQQDPTGSNANLCKSNNNNEKQPECFELTPKVQLIRAAVSFESGLKKELNQPDRVTANLMATIPPPPISTSCQSHESIALSQTNSNRHVCRPGTVSIAQPSQLTNPFSHFQSAASKSNLTANIKTAFMLFVVSAIMIVVYTPALLISFHIISYNAILWNLYYFNHAANPLVYSFLNSNFRKVLKAILNKACKTVCGLRNST